MSVKFTAQQEMEAELAFEILGALGDFIDKLSDEAINKIVYKPLEFTELREKIKKKEPVYLSDIEDLIENPVLQEYKEFVEIKEQISSKLCDNIKTKVEKHSSMQLLNEETLDDGSVLLTISV